MPAPASYRVVGCTRSCTSNEYNLPPGSYPQLHAMFEAGMTEEVISHKFEEAFGKHLSYGALKRHRRGHLHRIDLVEPSPNAPQPAKAGGKRKAVSELDLLNLMIAKGAEVLDAPNVKITPEQLLRAMEMKIKLTQGSAFQDFFDVIGALSADAAEENPAAVATEDEQGETGDG